MFSLQKLIVLIGLLAIAYNVSAQNQDILWQKTLTKDTIPITSIAIAEGKYVAVLKGDEIVILDYNTGDSIRAFAKPKDMYGTDIILGKGGERLYVLRAKRMFEVYTPYSYLFSWDIVSGDQFSDTIQYYPVVYNQYSFSTFRPNSYTINSSLDGNYILVSCSFGWDDFSKPGQELNGYDSKFAMYYASTGKFATIIGGKNNDDIPFHSRTIPTKSGAEVLGGTNSSSSPFSPSGNYCQINYITNFYRHISGGYPDVRESKTYGFINSRTSKLPSYKYNYQLPFYIFSSNDNFVLEGNNIKDIPPTHIIRSLNKTGFVFLPDDNHMLSFNAAGGVAAISNIEKDTWEKVYQGDSLTENIIQTNASRSAFATASNNRITFWQIPNTLEAASFKADFMMSKDTIPVFDTISFTNRTFPLRSGAYFEWNFGDGSAVNKELHPNHIFNKIGTYNVTLQVSDTLGRTTTTTKTVTVQNYKIPDEAVWVNRINENPINCIAYSHEGQLISSGSYGSAVIWNTKTSKFLKSISFKGFIFSTIFTKDDESLAIGTLLYDKAPMTMFKYFDQYQNYMSIWNLATDSIEPVLTWNVISDMGLSYISIKQFSATSDMSIDNKWYFSGHKIIADWSYTNPDVSKDFDKYIKSNQHVGNLLSYNFDQKKSRFWKTPFSETQFSSSNSNISNSPPVYSIRILPNSQQYVSIVESKDSSPYLLLRDIATDSILRKIPVTATSMHFSPDKFHLLTNTGLWNIYDSILVKTVDLPSTFEYHPDGIHVFTLLPDSTIGIYNLNTNSYEYIYPKQPTTFTAIAVAPDGKHIATGDKYGYITVWNVPDSLKASFKVDFNTTLFKRSNLKENDTVTFANTTLPANNTFDFLWNFGDGSTSTEKNPKHVYFKSGTYTVTLSALNNGKVIDSMTKLKYITIEGALDTDETKIGLEASFNIIPNPSYGETTLRYTLSQPSPVQIRITDVLGREVSSWSLNEQAGEHSIYWNSGVSAGMYYCMFSTGGITKTLPVVLLR